MFKLLIKIFGKKKDEKETGNENYKDFLILREVELEKYINYIVAFEENRLLKEVQDFMLNISEKLVNFEKSLLELDRESISLPDKQVEMVVNSKKKEFLEKLRRIIENLKSLDTESLDSFSKSYEESLKVLREVNALSLKDFISIKDYFIKSKDVVENFKQLFEIFLSFESKLKERKIVEIFEIKKVYTDYIWLKSEIISVKNDREKVVKEIEEKRRIAEDKKSEIFKIENSEEMKKLIELQKEKMKISYKQRELASICVEKFSSVEYIFKKLKKYLENFNAKEAKVISELIDSPFDVTISKDIQEVLENVLEFMKKSNFSQEEISKVESLVNEKIFSRLKSEYDKLEERLLEIYAEIEKIDVVNKRLSIEKEIKSIEFEIEELVKKLENIDRKIAELESLLSKVKESLETKISKALGKEVKIFDQPMYG